MTREEVNARSQAFSDRFGDVHEVPMEEAVPIPVKKAQELWSIGIPILVRTLYNRGAPVVATWADPFSTRTDLEWFAWVEKQND